MRVLTVDRLEIDARSAAREGRDETVQSFKLPMGDRHSFADSRALKRFALSQDAEQGLSLKGWLGARKSTREFRQNVVLRIRFEVEDGCLADENVGDLHGPLRIAAHSITAPTASAMPNMPAKTRIAIFPGNEPRLYDLPALRRGQDIHRFAVFGHRAARDIDTGSLQHFLDPLVRHWPRWIFALDDFADLVLHGLTREGLTPVRATDARVEEVFELKDALGRMNILVRRNAADRRLVHLDIVCDITKVQGLEMSDTVLEEVALILDDRLHHLVDRALTLVNRFVQQISKKPCLLTM